MVLLSLPGKSFPVVEIWKPDKIAHLLLFGTQFVLLWIALEIPTRRSFAGITPMQFAAIATIIFGVLSEGYQGAFTTRTADPFDMIANGIGVLCTVGIVLAIRPARVLTFMRKILRIPA